MSETGFLNIDKPPGLTSHDVVARIRRGLKLKKVGHAGTLDPLATGVLVVCVGAATRLSEYIMTSTKRYRATIRLGITTSTYDIEGEIRSENDPGSITRDQVERALAMFLGSIEQVPPVYSALKRGGRKLYELARAGESVELQARPVRIDSLTLEDWSPPQFVVEVVCSAGTYIRSLAHDLGEKLEVGAHLAGLTRTASGSFKLEDAAALDAVLSSPDWTRFLLPPDTALMHWPEVRLDAVDAEHILHGRAIPAVGVMNGVLGRAYHSSGQFVAVLQASEGCWKPHKVFFDQD